MLILKVALAAILTTRGTVSRTEIPAAPPAPVVFGAGLAKTIKAEIERISGPGSVDVTIDNETLFNVRIAVPEFREEFYTPIYDLELKLYRIFPELNFDFYLRLAPAPGEEAKP
jgi:hypothetical protein